MPLREDRLTKLIHEEELVAQLSYEMERARRYEWDLGLVLVEPDLPRELDSHMSYTALKRLATVCSGVMRVVDRGIRWGKGVFYILPETPPQGVEIAAKKIQQQFEETLLEHPTTGESLPCKLRKSIRVYSGKQAKENPAAQLDHRQLMVEIREALA